MHGAPDSAVALAVSPKPEELLSVLSEISRAVASTLELKEVFSRVADSVRRVLPFDAMGVVRLEDVDTAVLYAAVGEDHEDGESRFARSDMSARLWPDGVAVGRIDDARLELDPARPLDARILSHGMRSILAAPLLRGQTVLGEIWFASGTPRVYGVEHEATLLAIADLATLALEHERLSSTERERRRRHEVLEALVPTLAKALDVRDVFSQLSAIAQEVLPHDHMALGLLSEDRRSVRIYAYTGERVPDLPESIPLGDEALVKRDWDFEIVRDVARELPADSEKCQILMRGGIRSCLKVPIRLDGTIIGGLGFHSRVKNRYSEEDVPLARRVADQVALALSHQQLAEEARRAADARAEAAKLEERLARLTEELESRDGFHRIVGSAKSWRDVLVQATKVALTETTVLLTGESGTGKEVIARAIHRASPRGPGPFVALNCAALPDHLLESELFGYEKGAFTGAVGSKPGRIEQAAGGVLFLDEAGEMSPIVQAKFLRVLEEREFTRLGGTRSLKADVRVIAATNRDLQAAIKRGEFREDLYYRLHVFEIRLPPLRERVDDILPLTQVFLVEIGRAIGRPAGGVSREAKELLLAHAWPGNVRELRNALERAVILAEGGLITGTHLPISVARGELSAAAARPAAGAVGSVGTLPPEGVDLETVEKNFVKEALEKTANNKSRAARLLGLTRAQLYSRIEKYGLR